MQAEQAETILVASSDALQRSLVAKYLRECGYRVIEATGVEEAKIAIEHEQIDLVVADTEMRDGTGFDLSSSVKMRGIDIQVLLTQSVAKTAQLAGDLCEQGPLDQPYHPQQLVDEIKRLRASRR
jgi:DNA-binding NtrC family response regulator